MATPTKITWLFDNLLDLPSTVLTSNVTMSFPLSNLKDRDPQAAARFAAVSDVQLQVDLGSARNVQAVAWLFSNLRAGATVEVRHNTTNSFATATSLGSVTFQRPTLITGGYGFHLIHFLLFDALSKRYWFLKMDDVGNPDGYLDLGRVFVGPYFDFPISNPGGKQVDPGFAIEWIDNGSKQVTAGGRLVAEVLPPRRQMTFALGALQESEVYPTLFRIMGQIGTSLDFWTIVWPADATLKYDHAIYGQLMQGFGFRHQELRPYVDLDQVVIQESR